MASWLPYRKSLERTSMPEKKRTFESDSKYSERLRVKSKHTSRIGADQRVCPAGAETGVIAEMQVSGFSRETILRLIEWMKQV
jgi:hypothetical protein